MVTILTLLGKVSGRQVKVDMTGGRLIIDVQLRDGTVENLFFTGPTNVVAEGLVLDEDQTL